MKFAKEPLQEKNGWVHDADGDLVMVCNDDSDEICDLKYKESFVESDPHFTCEKCGRPSFRMDNCPVSRMKQQHEPDQP